MPESGVAGDALDAARPSLLQRVAGVDYRNEILALVAIFVAIQFFPKHVPPGI